MSITDIAACTRLTAAEITVSGFGELHRAFHRS